MNKKNKPKVTGINDVDTDEMKKVRETVIEQELSARSWKAWYEKMYYTIECEKIQPLYDETKARMDKKAQEAKAQFENFKKNLAEQLQKQNEADEVGNLQVEGLTANNTLGSADASRVEMGERITPEQEETIDDLMGLR